MDDSFELSSSSLDPQIDYFDWLTNRNTMVIDVSNFQRAPPEDLVWRPPYPADVTRAWFDFEFPDPGDARLGGFKRNPPATGELVLPPELQKLWDFHHNPDFFMGRTEFRLEEPPVYTDTLVPDKDIPDLMPLQLVDRGTPKLPISTKSPLKKVVIWRDTMGKITLKVLPTQPRLNVQADFVFRNVSMRQSGWYRVLRVGEPLRMDVLRSLDFNKPLMEPPTYAESTIAVQVVDSKFGERTLYSFDGSFTIRLPSYVTRTPGKMSAKYIFYMSFERAEERIDAETIRITLKSPGEYQMEAKAAMLSSIKYKFKLIYNKISFIEIPLRNLESWRFDRPGSWVATPFTSERLNHSANPLKKFKEIWPNFYDTVAAVHLVSDITDFEGYWFWLFKNDKYEMVLAGAKPINEVVRIPQIPWKVELQPFTAVYGVYWKRHNRQLGEGYAMSMKVTDPEQLGIYIAQISGSCQHRFIVECEGLARGKKISSRRTGMAKVVYDDISRRTGVDPDASYMPLHQRLADLLQLIEYKHPGVDRLDDPRIAGDPQVAECNEIIQRLRPSMDFKKSTRVFAPPSVHTEDYSRWVELVQYVDMRARKGFNQVSFAHIKGLETFYEINKNQTALRWLCLMLLHRYTLNSGQVDEISVTNFSRVMPEQESLQEIDRVYNIKQIDPLFEAFDKPGLTLKNAFERYSATLGVRAQDLETELLDADSKTYFVKTVILRGCWPFFDFFPNEQPPELNQKLSDFYRISHVKLMLCEYIAAKYRFSIF